MKIELFLRLVTFAATTLFAVGIFFYFAGDTCPKTDFHGMRYRHIKMYDSTGLLKAQGWIKDSLPSGWWHFYKEKGDSTVFILHNSSPSH